MKIKFKKEEVGNISQKLLNKILKMKNNKARVVALSGDLGAGKTTITQELGKLLGIKENMISPTFIIMKIYKINSSKYNSHFKKLIHIDAYRLESPLELLKIGWNELKGDKDNLILIEWPERVKNHISLSALHVSLSHIDVNSRSIKF